MTTSLNSTISHLRANGMVVTPALMGAISPYVTRHLRRFGDLVVDLSVPPAPVNEGHHLLQDLPMTNEDAA